MNKKHLERIGEKKAFLEIIDIYHRQERGVNVLYANCKCECGKEKEFTLSSFTFYAKSCGCKTKELNVKASITHGMTDSRLYKIRKGMKQRCYDEKTIGYKYYGGKGIKVCDEWLDSFESFYEWAMNNGYKDDLSIDRIDGNKDYCPENCRWATTSEQAKNKDFTNLKEKARKRMNKKVRQIDMKTNEVIKEFESISKAKEETGITTISHYLNGRSNHSGGFYWEYCN